MRQTRFHNLWQENIEPTEYDSDASKKYREALRLIFRKEEKTLSIRTDDQKEPLELNTKYSCSSEKPIL